MKKTVLLLLLITGCGTNIVSEGMLLKNIVTYDIIVAPVEGGKYKISCLEMTNVVREHRNSKESIIFPDIIALPYQWCESSLPIRGLPLTLTYRVGKDNVVYSPTYNKTFSARIISVDKNSKQIEIEGRIINQIDPGIIIFHPFHVEIELNTPTNVFKKEVGSANLKP